MEPVEFNENGSSDLAGFRYWLKHPMRGVIIATSASVLFILFLWGLVGTDDIEEQFNGLFSLGAVSDPTKIFSFAPRIGKSVLMLVPIYDTSIGLGYRLPLLYGLSHSPFAFLRHGFTAEFSQFVMVALATVAALYFSTEVINGWLEKYRQRQRTWLLVATNLALIGPASVYLFVTDWPTQAVQYFGGVILIITLLDKSWYNKNTVRPFQLRRIPIGFAIGIVLLVLGHPGNLPNYFLILIVLTSFSVSQRRLARGDAIQLMMLSFLSLATLLPMVLDVALESAKQPFPRVVYGGWYSIGSDYLGLRHLVIQFVSATIWPIVSMLSLSKSITVTGAWQGYLGTSGILVSVIVLLSNRQSKVMKTVTRAILISIFLSLIQSYFPDVIANFRPGTLWQFKDPMVVLSVMLTVVALGSAKENVSTNSSFRNLALRFLCVFTLVCSALYIPAIVQIRMQQSPTGAMNGVVQQALKSSSVEWKSILNSYGVEPGDRLYVEHSMLFRGSSWFGYNKLPQFTDLGVSTINGWPKMRSSFTLAENQFGSPRRFYNIIDTRYGCKPEEMELLSVQWVLVSNDECRQQYENVFGSTPIARNLLPSPPGWPKDKSVWLYEIKRFSSYYISGVDVTPRDAYCPLLSSSGCIKKLGITKQIGDSINPLFQFCITGCLAHYEWKDSFQVAGAVVPLDFDKTIVATRQRDGKSLIVKSHHGLLVIEPDVDMMAGDKIELNIRPDSRMWISAVCTWLQVLLVLAVIIKSRRSSRLSPR